MSTAFVNALVEQEDARFAGHDYCAYHAPRFAYLERLCLRLCPHPASSVLDVGRSEFSYRLATHYSYVVTLGFPLKGKQFGHNERREGGREPDCHITFDLNRSREMDIPCGERFDLIVFAEVIEHLHTAPEFALHALAELLKPHGYLLCQTPNAVNISNRLKMLAGRNPFERIRVQVANPGHFREYTRAELIDIGRIAELTTVQHRFANYFAIRGPLWRLRLLGGIIPSLRHGQTIVYRRKDSIT